MGLFGSSGIRAVFNETLLDLAFGVGLAVGRRKGSVVVGRDTRPSGEEMRGAVIAGLRAAGARCTDAGVVPTPTLAFITREYDAGVMVTASHNPPEYNGVKLLNPDGSSFDSRQRQEIEAMLSRSDGTSRRAASAGETRDDAVKAHVERILRDLPGGLRLKVVVDAGGGAACRVTPGLLERLGCEVISLNCEPGNLLARVIEPAEANLAGLMRAVRESGADLGIAHDGDADRMTAVDERGRFIPGDRLLAIFARAMKARRVVTTVDASMAIDEMGFQVTRTRVGDTYVSEELRNGGDFGGEAAGAWVFPEVSLCPDGIHAAARIAAIASQQRLSTLADAVPAYPLIRGSIGGHHLALTELESRLMELRPLNVSYLDGLRLAFENGWLLVRPSGTEPKIRLTAEGKTEAEANKLYENGLSAIMRSAEVAEGAS